jgi:predicted metal-dependent hydrolase
MDSRTVIVDGIGAIEYRKSARVSKLRISVHRDKGISVSFPKQFSFDEAEKLVLSRLQWIKKAIGKLDESKKNQTIYNEKNPFSTKFRTMNLIPEDRTTLRLKITDTHFDISYPRDADVESDSVQSVIRQFIEHVWKLEAYEYLPAKLTYWTNICNFTYKSLTIKNIRSFWGKCGVDNSIVLSLHLMHLPEHLIDYVILHELCHTVHKNHQKEFWKLLDKCTSGNAKSLAKEMRNYSTRIY